MANKFAIATGNWNNTAIWNDSVVPTTGDNVWANSFTVTLNQDVDVNSLRSDISPVILPFNPIPLMTDNITPSGTASAGTNDVNAFNVFDQDALTSWTSVAGLGTTAWVSYQLTSGVVAKRYYILRPTITTNRPTGWLFQGSNDGSSWTTLDTVVGDVTTGGYTSGTLANTTSYTYYRILVNTVSAGANAQIFTFEISPSTGTVYGGQNGGGFTINSSRTITCSEPGELGIVAGLSSCLNISATSSIITINGNVRGGTTTNTINTIQHTSTAASGNTINFNGNLRSVTTTRNAYVCSAPNTTIVHNGTLSAAGSTCLTILASATNTDITSTGDITDTIGNVILHSSTGNITINGNLIPSGVGYCIGRTGGANVIINGNVYGAAVSTGFGITTTTTNGGQITINGDVYGGNAAAINFTSVVGLTIINGNVSAGPNGPGVTCNINTNTALRISGNLYNTTTTMAVWHSAVQLIGAGQFWVFTDESGNDKTLYSPGTDLGNPAIGDVRQGTTYAGGILIGTLAVPPTSAVSVGVPVDNTVGTGIFTIADMGALLASYNV
jgi:hypothetical protein